MGRVGEDTAESAGRGASTEPRTYFDQQRKPLLVATDTDEATVLVVEDEARVADTYAMRLRDRCATTVAYDGEEALETVNEDVDVILLDRRMPEPPATRSSRRSGVAGWTSGSSS